MYSTPLLSFKICLDTSFSGLQRIPFVTHPGLPLRLQVAAGGVAPGFLSGQFTAFIIISPNDKVIPTIAGTKASPMNSFKLKLSSSHQRRFDPATKRNVKSGENMAYIQSFIALTKSIAASARVRSQNTKNIIAPTTEECTILSAAFATSSHQSSLSIF